jgi:hypothetical protein
MVSCPAAGKFWGDDMKELTAAQQSILGALGHAYYEVVPLNLRTYCSLTSEISKNVLAHFGIEARCMPCQVWCTVPDQNFVVGFVGNSAKDGKWDGHAICSAGNWFIDTALHHFKVDFNLEVPAVAYAPRFDLPTQAISRVDLNPTHSFWWHHPPQGVDTTLPQNPPELVAQYAAQLIERLGACVPAGS